jgi:excisionase family DNA binding protein
VSQPAKARRLPSLLDITAVAGHLGVEPRHVRRLVAERRIPYIKWDHLLRFDADEIAEWIDENRRQVDAESLAVRRTAK